MKMTLLSRTALVCLAGGIFLGSSACSALFGPKYRDSNGVPTASASVSPTDLKVDDCIANVTNFSPDDNVNKVQVVPCSTEHEAQVFAVESNTIANDDMNGAWCQSQFQGYVGSDYDTSSLWYTWILSTQGSSKTNATVTCILVSDDMVTGTLKDSQK